MNVTRGLSLATVLALLALAAAPALAGEWHAGTNNICSDCHTMHFSMQHTFDGAGAVAGIPAPNGNWLGGSGPNNFLLKAPANELCLSCHDGQSFAPDVLGANANASPASGREAGALNEADLGAPYEDWKGHTLGSTTPPPGYNPAAIGAGDWYDPADGLECVSCHAQHGSATSYRNLGPYSLGGVAASCRPTYAISGTNDTTKDVWINQASYAAGSGVAATFSPFYATANISFNRNDAVVGDTRTSNKIDTFCASCHGDFHGGAGDANIGATQAAMDGFIRHPTSQTTLGTAGGQGYGGHSSLSRFQANTTKVKVYASAANSADATPGCLSCHKAHGNENPFGLVFMNANAASVDEQGGYKTGQTEDASHPYQQAYRNLCGQCHSQGNS